MKYLSERALQREVLAGTWLNLGSSLTAEVAGRAGFDWLLIDLEHGSGDESHLLGQLQAISSTNAAGIVRVAWNEAPRVKRALDMGPSGIMIPYVNTAEEARRAVAAMRYPPQGVRGAARFTRAAGFGQEFESYFAEANANLLTIVQIETPQAVAQVEDIAAIEGVDVLFVGPLDLSVSLGIPQQLTHPEFRAALKRVSEAAKNANKAAGILLGSADQIAPTVEDGFTFLAVGSDGGMVAAGMKSLRAAFRTITEFREDDRSSTLRNAWNLSLRLLASKVSSSIFQGFIVPIQPFSYEDNVVTLGVDNSYAKDRLEHNHLNAIRSALEFHLETIGLQIQFVVNSQMPMETPWKSPAPPASEQPALPLNSDSEDKS